MKKWFIHILLLAGLFGMLTTSCSQDEALEQTGTTNGTVRIQFTLAMDGNAGSRAAADWGTETGGTENSLATDYRVAGDSYENMINLDQLQVFLFQGNKYLGEVGNLTLTPATSSKTYTFTGEITVKNATVTEGKLLNATIMVVANYEGYVNGNIAITQNYIFDYIADNYRPVVNSSTTTYGSYIPMWGMLKTDISLNESTFTEIGDIYMLRSMAKIEVELGADVDDDYVIIGASLNKYNQQGYLLPAKYPANGTGTASYFNATSTSSFDTEDCMNPYSSVDDDTSLYFNVVDDGKSCVVYLPEYNSSTKDLRINLQIATTDAPTVSISEDLKDEATFTLDRTALIRNHWYKCTIKSIDYNNGLECVVQDWNWQQEKLEYEDFVSVEEKINVIESAGTQTDAAGETHVKMKSKTLVYGNESATKQIYMVQLKFKIQTPTGYQWRASLIQDDMTRIFYFAETSKIVSDGKTTYPISVNADGNLTTSLTVSGQVGEEAVLTIVSEELNLINTVTARLQIMVLDSDVTSDYIIVEPEALGGNYYITQTP